MTQLWPNYHNFHFEEQLLVLPSLQSDECRLEMDLPIKGISGTKQWDGIKLLDHSVLS